ncbi:MAG: hypothetical protein QOC92_1641 [Acidimicrobiaceae bacterium]
MHDDLADLYDDVTCAVLDRQDTARTPASPEVASGWRAGVGATALLTAVALGVHDVLEPKRRAPVIEEIDLDTLGPSERAPVVYHHVPGVPKASRAIVRPWFLG